MFVFEVSAFRGMTAEVQMMTGMRIPAASPAPRKEEAGLREDRKWQKPILGWHQGRKGRNRVGCFSL